MTLGGNFLQEVSLRTSIQEFLKWRNNGFVFSATLEGIPLSATGEPDVSRGQSDKGVFVISPGRPRSWDSFYNAVGSWTTVHLPRNRRLW